MADNSKATARRQPGLWIVLLLLPFFQSYTSACLSNQCNSGGICFRLNQVMLRNVTKCFQIVCRPSMITGVSSVVRLENVGDCGQCCEHNGDLFAVGEEVFMEQDDCTRTCTGQDAWSGCNEGSSTPLSSTTRETTTQPNGNTTQPETTRETTTQPSDNTTQPETDEPSRRLSST